MSSVRDLTGQRFGRLTVLRRVGSDTRGRAQFECLCHCGAERVVAGYRLVSGNTTSCGCLLRELLTARNTKHGQSSGPLSAMYRAWNMTKQRCLNPRQRDYGRYGGRGVTICERWLDFDAFVEDMGPRPSGATLERTDNSRGYEPGNCVWAPRKQQTRNRDITLRMTVAGETRPLVEWAELSGISYDTLKARYCRLGWTPGRCVSTPVRKLQRKERCCSQ